MDKALLIYAGVATGLVYLIEKKVAVEKYHPAAFTIIFSLIDTILAIGFLFLSFKIPTSINYWLLAIVSICAYGVGNVFGFKAFKLIDASVVGIISRLNLVVAAFFGILLLHETYTTQNYIGLALVLLGSLVIAYEKGNFKISRGIWFSILMALGYGLAAVFDKILVGEFSPYTYVFVNSIGVGICMSLLFPKALKQTKMLFHNHPKPLLLGSVLNVSSWAAFLLILSRGEVSKTFPIYDSLSLIVTVILGIIVLKETSHLTQKIIGLITIVFGIILLG